MLQSRVSTRRRTEFVSLSEMIQETAAAQGWKNGVLTVFIPHTTAGITIQENADPDVLADMEMVLEKMVPWDNPQYRHAEGNTAAHVKSSLMGSSVQLIFENGRPALGTWQSVFFAEFDGPRERKVWFAFQSEEASQS